MSKLTFADANADINGSGAIPRADWDRMREHAARYYAEIRARESDIAAIYTNVQQHGFTEEDIANIKQHVFFNEYLLNGVIERFAPSYDMAVSWQRLCEGVDIHEMDIVLLFHERMEYRLMKEQGLDYNDAHAETVKLYDYHSYCKALNEKEGVL